MGREQRRGGGERRERVDTEESPSPTSNTNLHHL